MVMGIGIPFVIFKKSNTQQIAQSILSQADISINGTQPWDIEVHNDNVYDRVMQQGSLGLGEAYMDGWWDCAALDQWCSKVLEAQLEKKIEFTVPLFFELVKSKLFNLQAGRRAFEIGEQHYDLGNELFELMLDDYMMYSCGYWKNAHTLEQAQQNKLELICQKLQLKPGMKLLDIGCGWGGLAYYAATHYGVQVTGITVSKEQAEYAQHWCKELPVCIKLIDYRDLNETFDRIVSVGMFEHVGYKNYRQYMEIAHHCLTDDGLFLLHTIGRDTTAISGDPWIAKYIFPNSMLPSICQIAQAFEGLFVMEDWHNFSADYDKTLMAWFERFDQSWPQLQDKYSDRFYRMWKYYLLTCAGLFRARKAQLWQIMLSKNGVSGGYESIR